MPYTVSSPPEAVKGLPDHAIAIFVAAYNAAFDEYNGDEAKSNATAWAAVKTKYEKQGEDWVVKESRVLATDVDVVQIICSACKWDRVEPLADNKWRCYGCGVTFESKIDTQYPKEAFAYTPDKGEWKLRLWEGNQLSKVQLNHAAASLSPGGLAGKRVDIKESDLPAVKLNIRNGYRAMGVPDEDIPKWVKETESRTLLTGYVPLTEAKVDKGTANITVIKAGFNSSKDRYYPLETLTRDHSVFEGIKMYADHPSEFDENNRPERSIRDWVATLKNVHMENNNVVGEAVIVEPWMQEKLATLRDKGMLGDMGISINAVGAATEATIEGQKTNYIERIARGRSVDFVTEAGAGGLVEMYEAERDVDVDFITLTTLKERRPDLVKEIETSIKNILFKEAKKQMELETQVKELQESNATLTTEITNLKTEKEAAEKAKLIAETKATVEAAVAKAVLPDLAKTRILERFKDAVNVDCLEEAIKAEQDYIAAITESGKVKGMGGGKADPEIDQKAMKESWKRMHPEYTDAQLEVVMRGR
jgi:cation transport regulator ChaB